MIHFSRASLASELVDALRGKAVFGDAHNGLFLAAPRRAGKSTFLQSDLKPALEEARVVVAYVDCPRRPNFDHPCRLNNDQGRKAALSAAVCG